MDKEKQIEEMAIIIEHACDDCNGTVDHCIKCPYKCTKQYGCGELKTATDLYNTGYRKIPENSIIISKWDKNYKTQKRTKTSKLQKPHRRP